VDIEAESIEAPTFLAGRNFKNATQTSKEFYCPSSSMSFGRRSIMSVFDVKGLVRKTHLHLVPFCTAGIGRLTAESSLLRVLKNPPANLQNIQ
jgi:hypothetical protein